MVSLAEIGLKTDVPVLVADQQGVVVNVNECFTAVLGWSPDELRGQMLTTIIPRNMRDAHNLGFSRFLTTGQPKLLNQPLELKAVTRDGRELAVEVLITAERQENRWVFAASLRPL